MASCGEAVDPSPDSRTRLAPQAPAATLQVHSTLPTPPGPRGSGEARTGETKFLRRRLETGYRQKVYKVISKKS